MPESRLYLALSNLHIKNTGKPSTMDLDNDDDDDDDISTASSDFDDSGEDIRNMAHVHTVQLPLIPESGIFAEIPFSAEDDPRGEELWQPIVKNVLRQLACYNRCVANVGPPVKDDHWRASAKVFAINKKITEIVQNAADAVESQTKDLSSAVRELYDTVELEDSNFQNGSWASTCARQSLVSLEADIELC